MSALANFGLLHTWWSKHADPSASGCSGWGLTEAVCRCSQRQLLFETRKLKGMEQRAGPEQSMHAVCAETDHHPVLSVIVQHNQGAQLNLLGVRGSLNCCR
jgi:hypothetical protein